MEKSGRNSPPELPPDVPEESKLTEADTDEAEKRNMTLPFVKDPVETCIELPDLLMEILVRLPVKPLMKFKSVSKRWLSLICSRHFTDLFFTHSSSRKQELVSVYTNGYRVISSSPNNSDDTSFPHLNCERVPFPESESRLFVNAVRGVMCYKFRTEIEIVNLTTKQVLILPEVVVDPKTFDCPSSFWVEFVYDDIAKEYKVLRTIYNHEGSIIKWETRVLVLGAGDSWRNPKSPPPPHRWVGQGISVKNVLYYRAMSHESKSVLICFDHNSEDFNFIEVPNEVPWRGSKYRYWRCDLMKYQDKLAVLNNSRLKTEGILEIWVAEDARKSVWSHKEFVVSYDHLVASLNKDRLVIIGTIRNGEVVVVCAKYDSNNMTLAYYDLEELRITRGFDIECRGGERMQTNLWNYEESILYLEI